MSDCFDHEYDAMSSLENDEPGFIMKKDKCSFPTKEELKNMKIRIQEERERYEEIY
jgi:hypothetical protein